MCGYGVARNENGTARFTVKTGDGTKHEGRILVAKCQGVGKRVFKVTVRGVGRHIGGL